jgi:uncharacterized protein with NRDE domain
MCTVTYIPCKDSILFSSNRDEDPGRKTAEAPALHMLDNLPLLYPRDGEAGGSWIGLNESGVLVILLNGGFAKHERKPAYRHSRGFIVISMLASTDPVKYWNTCNFDHIEPFSLVVYAKKKLYHLVWTGIEKHSIEPDVTLPHIWSSSTLYDITANNYRLSKFNNFIASSLSLNKESVLDFLLTATSDELLNGFIMNRNELVKTCSISMVEIHPQNALFEYHDLLEGTIHRSDINFIRHGIQAFEVGSDLQ